MGLQVLEGRGLPWQCLPGIWSFQQSPATGLGIRKERCTSKPALARDGDEGGSFSSMRGTGPSQHFSSTREGHFTH